MITRLVVPRVIQLVLLFLLVAVLGFFLLHAAPGDPARVMAGLDATPQQVAAERHTLGLDKPLIAQFFTWIGHLFQGNVGQSYTDHEAVTTILMHAAPPTIQLALSAFVIAVVLGIGLGVVSAIRAGSRVDRLSRIAVLYGIGVPNFVIGLILVLVFGWWFPSVMPYQGYVPILSNPAQGFSHTILPAICLAALPLAVIARQCRSSMLEVLNQDYITAARALGVSEREILWKDALKPALLPVLTISGLIIGLLLSGTVVMESVFGIHGLGSELVSSFSNRDYPVAIGVMLVFATGFLVINFLTDLAYGVVDPRIRRAYAHTG